MFHVKHPCTTLGNAQFGALAISPLFRLTISAETV